MADIAPAVGKAVVEAYYPEALKEADNARSRAQNGYAIAGAVAAAIVAAGVFGDIQKEQGYVQGIGVASLVLWLIAALAYIWTVAGAVKLPGASAARDLNSFATAVLDRARDEHAKVEDRAQLAFAARQLRSASRY